MNKLTEYQKKRNFNKTNEPNGEKVKSSKKLRFVVQHHLARKNHYDLRLEYKGTMMSWAVPKGPSYNPKDKRLAVKVEDHPLSYQKFEGTIPKGEYGGGTVMIWDEGTWIPSNIVSSNKTIKFTLYGSRLKGKWTLVPFKEDNWLLIKEQDDYYEYTNISTLNTSVKSEKTMTEIGKYNNINITNPDKIIFNKPKITKQMITDYYQKISIRMLPYIKNRLISTVRCPSGINKNKFYKKHFENIDGYLGKKILKNKKGHKEDYYYIKDAQGLLSEVQMNSYEFHIWDSLVSNLNKPDIMVFDLDPDEKLSLDKVREGVLDLKSILDDLNVKSFLKTSGGKGYHIIAKINSNNWEQHRKIAKNIAELMVTKWPEKYTSSIRKKDRKGRIFIDWVRNTKTATSVAPYSLRMKKGASISMPIKWSELYKVAPDDIKIEDAIKRLKRADPWKKLNQ